MIDAVGFDLGETLTHYAGVPLNWQCLYGQALARVWEVSAGAGASTNPTALSESDLARAEAVLARYNTRVNPRTTEVTAGRIFGEVLACWRTGDAGRAGAFPNASPDTAVRAEDAFFGFFQQSYAVYEDSISVLQLLQSLKLKTGVLTDVPYGMGRRFVDRDLTPIAAWVDVALTSVDVGHRKPAPDGFRSLASTLGVSPSRMLFVGNEARDIQGANAAGMRSVLLVRDGNAGGKVPEFGQHTTVFSLHEVCQLLTPG